MTDPVFAAPVESFPDVERLNHFFKKKIAKAKGEEAEAQIRQEWTAAKQRFYGEIEQRKQAKAKAIEDANLAREEHAKAEAEAIEQARKAYGSPASAGGGIMGNVAGNVPPPIQITSPRVEVEERKQ